MHQHSLHSFEGGHISLATQTNCGVTATAPSTVVSHPVLLRKFWEGDLLIGRQVNSRVL